MTPNKDSPNYYFINTLALRSFYIQLIKRFGGDPKNVIKNKFLESSYDPFFEYTYNDKKYMQKMKKICLKIKQIENNKLSENDKIKYKDILIWYETEIIEQKSMIKSSNQIYEWMTKNKGPHSEMMIMSYIEIFASKFLPTKTIYYFFKYCF